MDAEFRAGARLLTSLPWFAAGIAAGSYVITKALVGWHGDGDLPHHDGSFFFPAQWHAPERLAVAAASIAVFALTAIPTFMTSIELLFRNMRLLGRIRQRSFIDFPALVSARVAPVMRSCSWISTSWMAGVALWALFLVGDYTVVSVAFIVALFLIGVATFAVPHQTFRAILDRSQEGYCRHLVARVTAGTGKPDLWSVDVPTLAAVSRTITDGPPPVLTRRESIVVAALQVSALVTTIAKDVVKDRVKAVL